MPFVDCYFPLVGHLEDPSFAPSLPDLPAELWLDNRSRDVRLELLDLQGQRLQAAIINPSLMVKEILGGLCKRYIVIYRYIV